MILSTFVVSYTVLKYQEDILKFLKDQYEKVLETNEIVKHKIQKE